MKIWLLRHGRTADNDRRRYQGRRDVPLSEAGAAELCRADFSPEKVYVSPLSRARETARRLIDAGGCFSLDRLAINGGDLIALGVPATAQIGALLDSALSAVADGELEKYEQYHRKIGAKRFHFCPSVCFMITL